MTHWTTSQFKQHTQKESMKAIENTPPKAIGRNVAKLKPKKVSIPQTKRKPVKSKIILPTESALQSRCVLWFRKQYPNIILFAIPNAAKRSFALAAKMKKEGMISGIPDLMVAKKGIEVSQTVVLILMLKSFSIRST